MLLYSHLGLAAVSRCPELALDAGESEALAGSIATCLEVFDVRPDPRVEAIVGLVTTAGPIYATKYFLIRNRKNMERREARQNPPATSQANGEDKSPKVGDVDMASLGLGGANYVGRA